MPLTSVVPEKLRRSYQRISVDVAEFRSKYEAGKSCRAIAVEAGVSISVVRERLLEVGVVFRDRARPSSSPDKETLEQLYVGQRLSVRAMASKLGTNGTTIRQWLSKAGIPRRTIREAKHGQKPAPQTIEASVASRRKHVLPGRDMVGYKVDGYGYVKVWNAETQSYEQEHRLVLEKKLGRKLLPTEDGHHINGVKADNRPENLEVIENRAEHLRLHSHARKRKDGQFALEDNGRNPSGNYIRSKARALLIRLNYVETVGAKEAAEIRYAIAALVRFGHDPKANKPASETIVKLRNWLTGDGGWQNW